MSLHRRNPKRDTNETEMVGALRAVGADVTRISGKGAPDLLIRFKGALHGVEVKTRRGRRTEAQQASQWPIVRTIEDALKLLGVVS